MFENIKKNIYKILAGIGGVLAAVFYVLFEQKKDEQLRQEYEEMRKRLDESQRQTNALNNALNGATELKKENEQLKEESGGVTLDSFNAVNDLLSK